MTYNRQMIAYSSIFFVATLILLSFTLYSNAQTLYSCNQAFRTESNPFLHTIDPNTGATLSTIEITASGEQVNSCNGLAKDPTTGTCYIMLNVGPNPQEPRPHPARLLATIDTDSGIASPIGFPENTFASIAFTSDGTLYGVTGDGGSIPETLFTINKSNGVPTMVQTLGNGNDGEAIAFNPVNGLIYHASGNGTPNVNEIFETINPNTLAVDPIVYSGDTDEIAEIMSLVFQPGNQFLATDLDEVLLSITANGVVSFIGNMDHFSKGLAFDCGIPDPIRQIPTLSEWGLLATAAILGIIGFMVIRKRKATSINT